MRRALVTSLLVMTLTPATALGATAEIRLEVDRNIAAVGEEVQVSVHLEVSGQQGYDRYLPPKFEGFAVAGGGLSSQNIQMINWRIHRQESYVYTIIPQQEGTQTLGPAVLVVDGKAIKSKTVTLRVTEGTGPAATPTDPSDMQQLTPEQARSSVFIHAAAAPQQVYLGQQVVAVWSLYTQSDILGFQSLQQPTADHFWSEDLQSPQRLEFERQIVQGRVFSVATLARKALFPNRTGTLTVEPLAAQVRTLRNFSSAAVRVSSNPLTIEVLPLPEAGRPAGFPVTNVGRFEVWATLDRDRVKAGDAVTLKVVVKGSGNLSQLEVPPLSEVDGFKVYDPKIAHRLDVVGGVSGEKVLEYLLLPVRGGTLTVPPIPLSYFDPQSETYHQIRTEPLTVTVTGAFPQGGARRGDGAEKNVLTPGIRPPRPTFSPESDVLYAPHKSPVFWTLLLLPLGALVALGVGERVRARLTRETPRSQRRTAARKTRAHLKRAQELRQGGDGRAFFSELAAAIGCQLDHQMQTRTEGLTREELQAQMRAAGFDDGLVARTIGELENCDFARFTPAASSGVEMEEAQKRTRQLVDDLGRTVVKRRPGRGA